MKTGNSIVDAILTVILVHLTQKIIELMETFYQYLKDKLKDKNNVKSEYLIQGTITISTEYCSHFINFPDEYRAIMYQVSNKDIDIKYGRQFNQFDRHGNQIDGSNNLFSFSLNTDNEIQLSDDVYIRQVNRMDKSNDLKSSIEFYDLYIYSYTLKFTELKKIINNWIEKYKKFIKEYNDGYVYYFSYQGSNGSKDSNKSNNIEIRFESHKFYSNKAFGNVFFEDKEPLIKRLNFFIKNEPNYQELGIPYTLGLLFHGEPGCGKTSTIKAIANYTGRHVIEIPLSKIKTCSELKKIFFVDLINGHYVPSDKKIIVLEDIDCMSDIVHRRNDDSEENKKKFVSHIMSDITNNSNSNMHNDIYDKLLNCTDEKENTDDKLTLSYILNLIDGILEQRGRIIIVTSNHPEKLDEALLRPGRIDMKVNFKKCNIEICKQIIEFYYKKQLTTEELDQLETIDNYKWTPAEVFQICFNNPDDVKSAIKTLNDDHV